MSAAAPEVLYADKNGNPVDMSDNQAPAPVAAPANPDAKLSDAPGSLAAARANRWELFLAGEVCCPACSFCLWFGIGWVFVVIFMVKLFQEGTDIFSFEDSVVTSDINVQEYYGFIAAVGNVEGCEDDDHDSESACVKDETCQWNSAKEACEEAATCVEADARARELAMIYDGRTAFVALIYEGLNGANLFDDDVLSHIKDFEDEILTDVNGARNSSGLSPWDENWCKMSYPGASATTGKCGTISSFLNIFSMTDEGMETVGAQARAGYTNVGAFSCLCSTEAGLCSICETDGSAKNYADWPEDVVTCLEAYSVPTTTTTNEPTSGLPTCEDTSVTYIPAYVQAYASSMCATRPTCQWSAPGTHSLCTSTAFYHATDLTELVTGDRKEAALTNLCNENSTLWSALKQSLVGQSTSCSSKHASFAKTNFLAGSPSSQADKDEGDNFESDYISGREGWFAKEQSLESKIEDASGGKLRVMLFSAATLRTQFLSILMVDCLLSIGSLVMVWAYMWWTLESCFLATCAMFEIVFSLPVTMSIWTVFCGQQILFTQMLCIYMILGIGADDAFILYDAWLQSSYLEEQPSHWTGRFSWAYRRSFAAMQVTTATTCGSFLIGACSPLPQVQYFCIFAAIVVFVDWLFCETLFASAIVLHSRYLKNDLEGQCGGPGCCFGFCRIVSSKWRQRREIANPSNPTPDDGAKSQGKEKRWLERFSEGSLFNFLYRWRFAFLLIWGLAALAMVISAGVQLRTAEETASIGRDSLDTIRGIEIMLSEFSVGETRYASVVWGLDAAEPISEWGSSHDDDVAKLDPSTATTVATPTGQMEILDLCRAADLGKGTDSTRCKTTQCLIMGQASAAQCEGDSTAWRKYGVYVPDDVMCNSGRYCFMEDFARYWIYHIDGAACTAASSSAACSAVPGCQWDASLSVCYTEKTEHDYEGIPADEFIQILGSDSYANYVDTRQEVMISNGFSFDTYNDASMSGIRLNSAKTAISLAWVGFNATYPLQNTVEEANDWYDRWDAFHKKYNPTVGGVQTCELYVFMVTQNAMVQAAVLGILMSLLISFVVLLLVTWNWWVASLGLLNIVAITCVFMGIIPIMGWSLGENECIFLIAVVGLSVDYTVHLLHVYHHCPHTTRIARAREALSEMGVSVINSALTTLMAAVILFGCGFYFFFQFGAFIFFVIGFSIIMSITLLIPLLAVLGPQNEQGNLPPLRKRCQKVQPEKQQVSPAASSPSTPPAKGGKRPKD